MYGDISSREIIKKYLRKNNFTHVISVVHDGFGDVLYDVTPNNEDVLVKIVQNKLLWKVKNLI